MKNSRRLHLDLSTIGVIERALSVLPATYTVADVRGLIAGLRAEADPSSSPYGHMPAVDFESVTARTQIAWLKTLARAEAILATQGDSLFPAKAETPAPAPEPTVAATAELVARAAAKARGTVVDWPSDPTARAILRAGMKSRNEDLKDKPL